MRTTTLALVIVIVAFSQVSSHAPQDKSSDLSNIESRLVSLGEQEFATWKQKTVAPLEGSYDVVIHQWSSDDAEVSITIARYASEDQAQKYIQQFAREMKATYASQEDSDEAYSINAQGNSVAARKKHLLVFIRVNAKDSSNEKQLLKQANKLASKAIKG